MRPVQVDVVPLFDVLPRGKPALLDVLLRIRAPEPGRPGHPPRPLPPLNLAIVIDRSGSMAGEKLAYAQAAARQAVAFLGVKDRLQLVSFSDEVETLAVGGGASDHDALMRAIAGLTAEGSTALHAGWVRGASLLQGQQEPGALRRVLLVSDGQANRGERRPEVIAHQVRHQSAAGCSTSTLGVGRDFNEDLLEAMARAGDGEYHFVETPEQLPAIFEAELRSMTRTQGRRCSLALAAGPDVRVVEVLNDLERNPTGSFRLPNLVSGRTLEVVVRLEVAAADAEVRGLLTIKVAWDPVDVEGAPRQQALAGLSVPMVAPRAFEALRPAPAVVEQVLLLEAARGKQRAAAALDQGDWDQARVLLEGVLEQVRQGPKSAELAEEQAALERLLTDLTTKDAVITRKRSKAQSYERQHSRLGPRAGPGWKH